MPISCYTTNQAIKALKMLRENKDQFDLVISDVHMPDLDGFKLLELVGLEMDLPVITVPKRILDLMNVEGLTRENVSSHLQKYMPYVKKLSAVANQQANMVAALRGRDSSYLPMGFS